VALARFSEVVDSLVGLGWVLLVVFVVWKLLPTIRTVVASRSLTIKAGGAEISVQQASDTLAQSVEDLREQLTALKAQVEAAGTIAEPEGAMDAKAASPIAAGVPKLRRVLWVDDHPENNVYEVQSLRRKDVAVDQVTSTAEGLSALFHAPGRYDVVITDMGRRENDHDVPNAGLDFIERVREEDATTPIFVYASAAAVNRWEDAITAAGGNGVTSSATELLAMIGRVGLE
jgi:CheY-like chemotaxis protein